MQYVSVPRTLKGQKRHRVECMNLHCGWRADRLATGTVKPCPKCGGPVLPKMVEPGDRGPATGDVTVHFGIPPEDYAELRRMGGGSAGEAAAQIVRGVLAHRLAERLAGR